MPDNHSPLAKRKAAKKKKHGLEEGVIPYLTQKSQEELPVAREVAKVGAVVKKAFGKVYPGAREE